MRKSFYGLLAVAFVGVLMLPGAGFADRPTTNAFNSPVDTYSVGAAVHTGTLPILAEGTRTTQAAGPLARVSKARLAKQKRANVLIAKATARAKSRSTVRTVQAVGEVRNWLALDDYAGFYYRKGFTLRAVGAHAEVWVASELNRRGASGTEFLAGDCRNSRTTVTDAQVTYLLGQFDTNIWPKEAASFSTAPNRDGSNQILPRPRYNGSGDGAKTVILVDNVRDDNFYDTDGTHGYSYIAGFFSGQLNDFFDRNIMTIDAFDWAHRTGATPPNNPNPGNSCTNAPGRPFLYEGTFAHEYQHLLEHYADSDESTWLNEGLSDYAMSLTGYAHPEIPITQTGFDSHIQCIEGWLPTSGGPENSLTRWQDQGPGEILCDYGAAYSFMQMLADRYGPAFMSALHRGQGNGYAGLQEALTAFGVKKLTPMDITHQWSLTLALDGLLDSGYKLLGGTNAADVSSTHLSSTINWDNPSAYDSPGAPSNGSDYVRLRGAGGSYLTGDQIDSLTFAGAATLPTSPVAWTVDAAPPSHVANPALFSGADDLRDEAIVKSVTVGTGTAASLTFDALWNEEPGWDYGFAQISTDSGATYTSVACTDTTTETDPGALPTAKDNVPGFTDYSGGWKAETCSLSAYAGQTVLLAFRAFNDPATLGSTDLIPPGFWVDNVKVGATLVSDGSSLVGWKSFSETRPTSVSNFTVRIISVDSSKGKITVKQLPLTSAFELKNKASVQKYIDKKADLVAAIVSYDDPSESSTQYAPYQLQVNGVTQPGGGM